MYEDGFYKRSNIIGYTGDINVNPTVYFKNGNKFGRITQDHTNKSNIGRNEVRIAGDYRITNTHNGKAQEFYNGGVRHNSRNPFKPAGWLEKFKLAKAIQRFPNKKAK